MEPPSSHRIHITNESGFEIPLSVLERAVSTALVEEHALPCEVTVLLAPDEQVCSLNGRFRNLHEPTDVLTFPSGDGASGDIAIAMGFASRQAQLRGVALEQELVFLAIHGVLHLTGWNDETEPDQARMVSRMNEIALILGVSPDVDWHSLPHDEVLA